MKIDEAVKIAMEQNAFIRRKNELSGKVLIKPTNYSDCCYLIIKGYGTEKDRRIRCWNPTAKELMSDEWVIERQTNREVKKIEKMQKELDDMTIDEMNAFTKKEAKKAKIYSYIALTLSVIALILRIIILLVK